MTTEIHLRSHEYCDRGFNVVVNGEVVASADYDGYGWGGLEGMEQAVKNIAQAIGATVVDDR